MPNPTDAPLIFTSKGNVPCASLSYHHEWTVTEDVIKFREFYRDAAGEIVKDCAHVYLPKGLQLVATTGGL
jgi:hypothetical protein